MRITRLTTEQARAVGEALARAAAFFRQIIDAFRELTRRLAAALQPLVRLAQPAQAAIEVPGRPAWQSPYGPPSRRRA
ncbi:hypothetical protein [Streptomyces phaeochromogenes]|uniref:hypothetical protein n=1 Tax=Streptomyces phaeochromogenes TaxID=1923 RepID=UPI002DDA8F19|nr:hypothetical protein [Streptomyces phaeochromogenes]WRZ30211.1 hypothetical protein OG931_21900 [Streptomyces phaeochromogenes]